MQQPNDPPKKSVDPLAGSYECVGCKSATFRRRSDNLCPRCAHETESLIEQIELDGLNNDLRLIVEFEAYYRQREKQRKQLKRLAGGVFPKTHILAEKERGAIVFERTLPWPDMRLTG